MIPASLPFVLESAVSDPRYRYYTATTLDGYIADDADRLDWLLSQPLDESGPMNYGDFYGEIGAMVMGATTYQWIVDHPEETDGGWPYEIPCFVFTHREIEPVADTVTVVSGSPTEQRDALVRAARGKDVWIVGGGDLAGQFAEAGMLDEIIVSIAPVTLGRGRPLFPRKFDLVLIEVAQNEAFACARYAVAGPRRAAAH